MVLLFSILLPPCRIVPIAPDCSSAMCTSSEWQFKTGWFEYSGSFRLTNTFQQKRGIEGIISQGQEAGPNGITDTSTNPDCSAYLLIKVMPLEAFLKKSSRFITPLFRDRGKCLPGSCKCIVTISSWQWAISFCFFSRAQLFCFNGITHRGRLLVFIYQTGGAEMPGQSLTDRSCWNTDTLKLH